MSGIKVSGDCKTAHQTQKLSSDIQWTSYKMSDDLRVIVVDKVGPTCLSEDDLKGKTRDEILSMGKDVFKKFIDALPEDEPRYAVFGYIIPILKTTITNKLYFISWIPHEGHIRSKMLYSSSKGCLKSELAMSHELQMTSKNDLAEAFNKMVDTQ